MLANTHEARLMMRTFYRSADEIATIISEDANLMNGGINVGFLAVTIAETVEGKR